MAAGLLLHRRAFGRLVMEPAGLRVTPPAHRDAVEPGPAESRGTSSRMRPGRDGGVTRRDDALDDAARPRPPITAASAPTVVGVVLGGYPCVRRGEVAPVSAGLPAGPLLLQALV